MTPPDTPSLVERLRDANAGIEILKALEEAPHCKADLAKAERAIRDGIAHIEAQAAQIAALQSTNAHLHEGLAANAKEMADMVENLTTLRADNARLQRELEEVRAAVREARLRAASRNSLVQPGHLYKLDDTEAPDV